MSIPEKSCAGLRSEKIHLLNMLNRAGAHTKREIRFYILMMLMPMVMLLILSPLSSRAIAAEPTALSTWAKTAKLGGASLWVGMTPRNATGGAGSRAIRMGDDNSNRQYKAILSFDTVSVPDGATILSARLELTRGGNTGTNPFNTHGTCFIDVRSGAFGGNAALENSDFEAAADAERVAIVTNQGGRRTKYTVDLANALNHINKTGRTQLRLYFEIDDNNDGGIDLAGFYSADNSNAARRPRLIVEYQE